MIISDVRQSYSQRFGHAGLALIREMARISGLDGVAQKFSQEKQPQITNDELLRALCGLLCQGKTDFDHIKEFKDDDFFQACLDLNRTPSAEILRQRFQKLSLHTRFASKLPECSINLWRSMGMQPEYIQRDEHRWVRMDIDAVIFDNSDTQKEGAEYTYTNEFGFNPLFAHLGGGWMVNAQLRPGSAHSLASGTRQFIFDSLDYGKHLVQDPLLLVMDSGFDSRDVVTSLAQTERVDFIVKHNLRRESEESWIQAAKEQGGSPEVVTTRTKRQNVYRGSISTSLSGLDSPVRQVFEIKEITHRKGQKLLIPEIKVFAVWTSLNLPVQDVLKLYRARGTSEQYHAEFKSEMDMQRFPSGKFQVNNAFLLMGMLVYNMLKAIGQDLVLAKAMGLKKATRRRLKTVMRSIIFMCGKITRHARNIRLHLGCPTPWFRIFQGLFRRLKAA